MYLDVCSIHVSSYVGNSMKRLPLPPQGKTMVWIFFFDEASTLYFNPRDMCAYGTLFKSTEDNSYFHHPIYPAGDGADLIWKCLLELCTYLANFDLNVYTIVYLN